jgi:hypothetical protein
MTISKSKILSHTGVEYKKPVKQNNLQVTNTINVKNSEATIEPQPTEHLPETKAEYPKIIKEPHVIQDPESPELLKALLELYSSNVLRLNGDLIVKNVELIEIVKLATDADDVIIELDFEVNCCGSESGLNYFKPINCVHKGVTTDFHYNYNTQFNIQFNILRKYRVSLNITHD